MSVLLSISNDTNKKGEQTLTTAEINERKAEEYHRKDPEMKQFQRDYRKHVSEAGKYEELKRRDHKKKQLRKSENTRRDRLCQGNTILTLHLHRLLLNIRNKG